MNKPVRILICILILSSLSACQAFRVDSTKERTLDRPEKVEQEPFEYEDDICKIKKQAKKTPFCSDYDPEAN